MERKAPDFGGLFRFHRANPNRLRRESPRCNFLCFRSVALTTCDGTVCDDIDGSDRPSPLLSCRLATAGSEVSSFPDIWVSANFDRLARNFRSPPMWGSTVCGINLCHQTDIPRFMWGPEKASRSRCLFHFHHPLTTTFSRSRHDACAFVSRISFVTGLRHIENVTDNVTACRR